MSTWVRMTSSTSPARAYHHGDLRHALVEAATALAARDGVDGLILREAARQVGVSPSAAYRHFPDRDALLATVAAGVREALARRMLREMAAAGDRGPATSPRDGPEAVARFRACGRAYIGFALDEPGLFAVAFHPCDPERYVPDDPSPYAVLGAALDDVAAAGLLRVPRPGTEVLAWAAVHGAAVLLGERLVPAEARDHVIEGTLDLVGGGLLAADPG
jgi:AcrR family transcriptional regulator